MSYERELITCLQKQLERKDKLIDSLVKMHIEDEKNILELKENFRRLKNILKGIRLITGQQEES